MNFINWTVDKIYINADKERHTELIITQPDLLDSNILYIINLYEY